MYTLSVHIRVFAVIMTVLLAGLAWAAEEEPFFDTEEAMFPGRFPTIVVATDGTVLAVGRDGKTVRRSEDGGETWGAEIETGVDRRANAIVDEDSGDVLLVSPTNGYQWRSRDHGETWEEEEMTVEPNLMGHGEPYGDIDVHDFAPPAESPVSAHYHESGITLQHGEHAGRLLMPVRVFTGSNDTEWRPYHYNTSMYSDDGGETWQVSAPFPVFGTGEGTLAELSDGRIYYNSREHMTEGNRYIAWSDDGGETWLNPSRCPYLPDGPRSHAYGCAGGLTRLPIEDHDILVYSNVDDPGTTRQRMTVWASFDGGRSWPVRRVVDEGGGAYSSLVAGQPGTPGEGLIFLLYERRNDERDIQLARFNLTWLTNGKDWAVYAGSKGENE